MVTKTEFDELVSNAYQSLYDFVRLRSHPLTELLLKNDPSDFKERGWQVHRILLDAIDMLYPGATAPAFSKEWRRHRLLVLRYVEALDPQTVADQLAISRRQYYREQAVALEAIADLLWANNQPAAHHAADQSVVTPNAAAQNVPNPPEIEIREGHGVTSEGQPYRADYSDVMQRELARISQNDSYANLPEVIEGALDILSRVLDQHGITTQVTLPGDLPVVSVSHHLLRQVILGALGYLVEHACPARLVIRAENDDDAVRVSLLAEAITPPPAEHAPADQLAYLREMLQLGSADIRLETDETRVLGFALDLPLEYDWTVLAVDDNEDTLALYKRCLQPNRYRVMTTSSPLAVLPLAREIQPDVVILDLMMPEHDGWDLLQQLSNQPDTAHIPIMICSVLKQRDLALSLGAAAYLPKPFSEQDLLTTLDTLLDRPEHRPAR